MKESVDNAVIAIAPATKRFGVVVFRNEEIIYFVIKILKPPRTSESIIREVSNSIENLFKEFLPQAIVIKSPSKQQLKSNQYKLIAACVENQAKSHQIPVMRLKFETVKRFLCRNLKPNKTNTFNNLAAIYPELRQFTGKSSKWRKQYYEILLLAAALGYYCQTEMAKTYSQN